MGHEEVRKSCTHLSTSREADEYSSLKPTLQANYLNTVSKI